MTNEFQTITIEEAATLKNIHAYRMSNGSVPLKATPIVKSLEKKGMIKQYTPGRYITTINYVSGAFNVAQADGSVILSFEYSAMQRAAK